MRFLTDRISPLNIEWNRRPLAESDFESLCERFEITIHECPMGVSGFYYRLVGRDFIAVNSRLAGLDRLMVLFHELGHFLLHVPKSGPAANFYAVGRPTRQEREADVFALCALLPLPLIESRRNAELINAGFPAEMVAARLAIFDRHKV